MFTSPAFAEESGDYAKAAQKEFSRGNLLLARVLAVEAVKQAEVWEGKFPQCGANSGSNSIVYTTFLSNDALRLFRVEEGSIAYYDVRKQGVERLWKATLADNSSKGNKLLRPLNPISKQFSNPKNRKLSVITSCGAQPEIKGDMVEFIYIAPPGNLSVGILNNTGYYINKVDHLYDESKCQIYSHLKITYCKQLAKFSR